MEPQLVGAPRLRHALAGIAATALVLVLAGCAGEGSPSNDPALTKSVPHGATKEDYQAAFRDIDPIRIRVQTEGPKGSPTSLGRQTWLDTVEEWSGGKITFEWGYSNAFVPSATEWASGMADGRMDIGGFLPYYTPEVFPKLTELTNATFLDGNTPTATLSSTGWVTEVLYAQPAYQEEAEANGVHILALAPTANISGIFCTKPRTSLADLNGVAVSASGQGRVKQLSALGMAPQSIAFTELYEALERGVVGCGSTVVTAIESIGATELVPYATADPEASLVGFPAFMAIGKEKWDSLPRVAQQLLYDRLDTLFEAEAEHQMSRNVTWLRQAQAHGGGFRPFADDARGKLRQTNDTLLTEMASHGVDTNAIKAAWERWNGTINDKLYPDITKNLNDFLTSGGFKDVDLKPFAQAVVNDVMVKHRPS
ncbi:TRAP transporter substrate-binding protein DctP [Nonomuraea sp. NPDC005650]|uniref:TRAP transporter substrate-binding protein DctP n=1 Tax=Nonomuraea sp. NPDC005650 TaxID=3157045 RepID=UPI0033B3983D